MNSKHFISIVIFLFSIANLFGIDLSTKPDNQYIFGNKSELYVYISIQGGPAPKDVKRRPLNLSIVLDKSGSMSGDKLKYVKQAASFLTDQLSKSDWLSVVVYDTTVSVIQAPIRVANKQAIKSKISSIEVGGSTNLSGGMLEGYTLAKINYSKDSVNRVLLLSDGLANVGISDPIKLQEIAKNKSRDQGISISTFGVGADFDEKLMTGISEYGSGGYYFIDSPDKLSQIFGTELKGLLSVVAQNAKLKINFPGSKLRLTNVYGYNHQSDKDDIFVDFKDIFADETKAVLLKFYITDSSSSIKINSSLIFDDVESLNTVTKENTVIVSRAQNEEQYKKGKDAEVEQNILLFENNEIIENATDDVDKNKFDEAKIKLKKSKTRLESVKRTKELERQYQTIIEYERKIENIDSMDEQEVKVMQKANRSENYKMKKKR